MLLAGALFSSGWTWTCVAQTPATNNSQAAGQPVRPQTSLNPNAPAATPQASKVPPAQTAATEQSSAAAAMNPLEPLAQSIWTKAGVPVTGIRFEGVTFAPHDRIVADLTQRAGEPLDPQKVQADIRRLWTSGRYRNISVSGEISGKGVTLIYVGVPRYYVGRVEINGVSQERLTSLLSFATKLDPGTAFSEPLIPAALAGVRQSLEQNGFFEADVQVATTRDDVAHQVNVTFTIKQGPQARVGQVSVEGEDPGITVPEFRRRGRLDCGWFSTFTNKLIFRGCEARVTRDTTSTALAGVRNFYQKRNRLTGTASKQSETYAPPRRQLDYQFLANQGPLVNITIEGAKVSKSRKRLLIPIYEEATVDRDLVNEGAFNIREYMQRKGYFDAETSVRLLGSGTGTVTVQYTVNPGRRHTVRSVNIEGNKYFSDSLIQQQLRVRRADLYVRSGTFSNQLVEADRSAIEALYRSSGFTHVKVTAAVKDTDKTPSGQALKVAMIDVTYTIEEGEQQKFGAVSLSGVGAIREATIKSLLSAETGQPFSLITLSNDRDAVLSYYLAHGFDLAQVEIQQQPDPDNKDRIEVTLAVSEGQQVTIDRVLLSGLVHTRPSIVQQQILVQAEDPLDQAALLQTQRNLYNLALFNQVDTAVQNPRGNAPTKNVLVQISEAKRWDVTYGFGFEAQTGTPGLIPGGVRGQTAAQNGRAGVSPRGSLDISRINFRGTQQSLTLRTTFGLLERVATLTFNSPRFLGNPSLTAAVSGGYSNVQNITTFQSETLQGDFRVTQKYKLADTFIYHFLYRRVAVNANSLEITPNLIPQLSQPVTVGGPGITYFHDTRDPSPVDALRGQYFSVQEFLSSSKFGAQADFNRLDMSYSSYYTFGAKKYTFARNTRIGFQNVFGSTGSSQIIGVVNCEGDLVVTNPTCNPVPLPERMYAGGATSLRGFGINLAGPRDLTTGYPVGGSGVVVNSLELRMPPPTLPYVGNSVSFVLFHDMGNVFRYPSDMFTSIKHFRQPNQETCYEIPPKGTLPEDLKNGTGTCNFNNYSHAVGLGVRYRTPVGPIRLDFSWNLNPTVYPVFYDYTNNSPYVGKAPHFNFFFSIGQAF